jgi:hypothetical protein
MLSADELLRRHYEVPWKADRAPFLPWASSDVKEIERNDKFSGMAAVLQIRRLSSCSH